MKLFRENPQALREASLAKGVEIDIERILELDRRARAMQTELENISAQKNAASDRIAHAKAEERKGKAAR